MIAIDDSRWLLDPLDSYPQVVLKLLQLANVAFNQSFPQILDGYVSQRGSWDGHRVPGRAHAMATHRR